MAKDDTDEEGPITHPCTFHGCVQILEMISTTVALICSFLNPLWLTVAGGGFVSTVLIACLIFSAVFFFSHLLIDVTGRLKWQKAEWIGYICGTVLLVIALAVSIRGTQLQYIEETDDGRQRLIENSPIIVTAMFDTFAAIFYLTHSIELSLRRFRSKSKSKADSKPKTKTSDPRPNNSAAR